MLVYTENNILILDWIIYKFLIIYIYSQELDKLCNHQLHNYNLV